MVPVMKTNAPFHLAFPVHDLDAAQGFYVDLLGCPMGRRSGRWIDLDFFGNQITAHLRPEECNKASTNPVDGDQVPVRHFGAILAWDEWDALADKLSKAGVYFLMKPHIRFKGKAGEQGTFFVHDPSGNALEFKTFRDMNQIFAVDDAND